MATIIPFETTPAPVSAHGMEEEKLPAPKNYNVDILAYPGGYIEFTANGVRTDGKSLCEIADELEKIASIIRSDVITQVHV